MAPKGQGETLERLDHADPEEDVVRAVKEEVPVPLVQLVTRVLQENQVFLETVVHSGHPDHKAIVVHLVPRE